MISFLEFKFDLMIVFSINDFCYAQFIQHTQEPSTMSDAQKFRWVFSLLMSLLMSGVMSGWVTWIVVGLNGHFFASWGRAFITAWPAAFTIVMLCAPSVQKLSQRIVMKRSSTI
jgi:Protein of unknown function (DUF2798)